MNKKIFRWIDHAHGSGGIVLADTKDEAKEILNENLPMYWHNRPAMNINAEIWEAELDDDGELFKKSGILIC